MRKCAENGKLCDPAPIAPNMCLCSVLYILHTLYKLTNIMCNVYNIYSTGQWTPWFYCSAAMDKEYLNIIYNQILQYFTNKHT